MNICGPGESKKKRVKYLNIFMQDEREDQVKGIIYGDDIPRYQRRMKLYHTYRITGGHVQPPYLKYEKLVSTFDWVLDRRCIIDTLKKDNVDSLPLPTKLNLESFKDIKHHILHTMTTDLTKNEFDILAVVVNCSSPRYVASVEKRLQELIVINMFKETLTFTIWEEGIMENEGKDLLQQFRQYPVILARRVGGTKYNGVSLTTRFNTTIQIDPPYPQCQQLQTWVTQNREILTSFTLRSTSASGLLMSIPVDEEVVPIANIDSQQDGQTFSIEAKITFSTDLKEFYVLVCSNCGQDVRYPTIREIECMNYDKKSMLMPRCKFDVNLEDNSGSTFGMIIDKEGENLLSLTAEEIYKRASDLVLFLTKQYICNPNLINILLFFLGKLPAYARYRV